MELSTRCMSCGACTNACPKDAISMIVDENGFYKPLIDQAKCIECGKCKNVCPEYNLPDNTNYSEPKCYVIWTEDDLRRISSSGGAFSVLAEYAFSKEGLVFGCAFSEDFTPVHICTERRHDLGKLRKSKYVQSFIGYTYRDVEKALKEKKVVLFSGLPCQIAALSMFLGKDYDNLYTIDLVCSGNNPIGVWKQYLNELEKKHGKLNAIDFRSKKYGWGCGSVFYSFENGKELDSIKDSYMRAFLQGMYREEACADCKYAGFPRYADITIGDFWNIDKMRPDLNDNKGTGLLIVNSEKGNLLLESIKSNFTVFEEIGIEFTKCSNMFVRTRRVHEGKDVFFKNYREGIPVTKAIERAEGNYYDICICGPYCSESYGAELAYYALYRFLTDQDYDVAMIDKFNEPRRFKKNPYPLRAVRRQYDSVLSMDGINDLSDTFLVGVEQIWNWRAFGDDVYIYTLPFVEPDKRMISYATSFGCHDVEVRRDEKRYLKYMLNRFHAVSVGEDFGVEICEERYGVKATRVIDPVFLVDKYIYDQLASLSEIKSSKEYLFCYLEKPSDEVIRTIGRVAKQKNWDVIFLGDDTKTSGLKWDVKADKDTFIEDWLKLLINSQMVVTDSVHVMCLSVIYEKNIVSLWKDIHGMERIKSMTRLLGLKAPVQYSEFEEWDSEQIFEQSRVDYSAVNERLKKERKASIEWFLSSLTKPISKDNTDPFFEAFGLELINQKLNEKARRVAESKKYIDQVNRHDGSIVIFGLGNCFENVISHVTDLIRVDFLCDNSKEKWGKFYPNCNKKCISVSELKQLKDPYVIITIWGREASDQIYDQLKSMGIKDVIKIGDFYKRVE